MNVNRQIKLLKYCVEIIAVKIIYLGEKIEKPFYYHTILANYL